jgi:NADH dehydrogenase
MATLPPSGSASRLVTLIGGSGFVGAALTEAFARAGWRVLIVARNPARAERLKPLGDLGQIAAVRGDIRVPASLEAPLAGADLAVNLVGILDEKGGQRFAEVQARGAGSAAAAARAAGVAGFIHVSAIGADPASPSAYGRTKGEGEALVRAAFPDAAIVRPSLIFGANDGFTNRFASLIALAPMVPVIAPGTRFQPVHVRDVAAAILAIAGRLMAGRPNGIWELGGPEVLTMRQIMAFIAEAIGKGDAPLVDVPDSGARLLASFGFLPGAPLTQDQYLMLQRDNVVSEGAAGFADLGITPVALEATAPDWLARYRRGGRFAA